MASRNHRGPPGVAELHCVECPNRQTAEWSALSEAEIEVLAARKRTHYFPPGRHLYYEGDSCRGIYCVYSGLIGLNRTEPGSGATLAGLAPPGGTVGARHHFHGQATSASAHALTPTTACFVDGDTLRELLQRNPALGTQFLANFAQELEMVEERLMDVGHLPVRQRVAKLLLTMRDRFGGPPNGVPQVVHLPISRERMAELISVRSETLSRALTDLERDGLVALAGRQMMIPSLERLEGVLEAF